MLKSDPLLLPGRNLLNAGMLAGCGASLVPLLGTDSMATGLGCLGVTTGLSSVMGLTLTSAIGGMYTQGCQFSDFSLISDFLRIKETGIKLIKYVQNMDKISIVSKDRLDNGKGLDNLSLNTVSKH